MCEKYETDRLAHVNYGVSSLQKILKLKCCYENTTNYN